MSEALPSEALPSGAPTSERRALTRAQFEAAAKGLRHGTSGHLAFGCPQCSDPMKGLVEDSALLNGPAEVWN